MCETVVRNRTEGEESDSKIVPNRREKKSEIRK